MMMSRIGNSFGVDTNLMFLLAKPVSDISRSAKFVYDFDNNFKFRRAFTLSGSEFEYLKLFKFVLPWKIFYERHWVLVVMRIQCATITLPI